MSKEQFEMNEEHESEKRSGEDDVVRHYVNFCV